MQYNTQPPDGKYKTEFFIVLYTALNHEFLDLQTCLVDKIVINHASYFIQFSLNPLVKFTFSMSQFIKISKNFV